MVNAASLRRLNVGIYRWHRGQTIRFNHKSIHPTLAGRNSDLTVAVRQ